jgi:hypothetical protein
MFFIFKIIQRHSEDALPAWMSTASTEPIISAAAGLPIHSQVIHVIREEVYKTLEETDSGRCFAIICVLLIHG